MSPYRPTSAVRPVLALACLATLTVPVSADDWPQWRGPNRDDRSAETGLLKTWPKDGPKLVWTFDGAGIGYSSVAVVGKRLFSAGATETTEYVFAVDVETGNKLWSTDIGPRFKNGFGDGPRATPTIDGDLLFCEFGGGEVVCLEAATGKKRWLINLTKDLGGKLMSGWGYSESPLVDGDQVVVSPGGAKGALAALEKKTGKVIWRSKDLPSQASYSSIVPAEILGVRQYVQTAMADKGMGLIFAVAPKDGKLLWKVERPGYATAVIPTPVVGQNFVYATSGYGAGCDLVEVKKDGAGFSANKVYTNKQMVNHHGGVLLFDDHIYGFTDSGQRWVCQDFKTGKQVWDTNKAGKGSVTFADGHLYCFTENNGTVVLVKASPKGWEEDGRFTIPTSKGARPTVKYAKNVWAHPVVANGKLYLRDLENIYCYDVSSAKSAAR